MNKKLKYHQSIIPGYGIGSKVVNKDINFALRNWKRKLKNSNILLELKEKREYIKPSARKRQQLITAKYTQKIKDLHIDD
tara:strand:- start:1222 stop:1461 length:240 start_codon:yes stop_codon:yes gene_type:complete